MTQWQLFPDCGVPSVLCNPLGAASDSLHSRHIGESAMPGVSHSCLRYE